MKIILILFVAVGFGSADFAQATIVRLSQVSPALWRGSQPEDRRDMQLLRSLGIRTIINLRTSDATEERDLADEVGIDLEQVSLSSVTSVFAKPSERDVNRVLELINDPRLQPVFIHCAHGKDRTGLIVGLYRVFEQQWKPRRAYREMKQFDFSSWYFGLKEYFEDATGEDL
jgi:protein tyrosine/serine phosphatase